MHPFFLSFFDRLILRFSAELLYQPLTVLPGTLARGRVLPSVNRCVVRLLRKVNGNCNIFRCRWLCRYVSLCRRVLRCKNFTPFNQAFSAILFLLREVVGCDTISLNSIRAKRGPHLPSVFSEREVAQLLAGIDGTPGLILRLIYTHVMRSLASSAVSPLDALARGG